MRNGLLPCEVLANRLAPTAEIEVFLDLFITCGRRAASLSFILKEEFRGVYEDSFM
jgi:mitochondrial fission protein ELM1